MSFAPSGYGLTLQRGGVFQRGVGHARQVDLDAPAGGDCDYFGALCDSIGNIAAGSYDRNHSAAAQTTGDRTDQCRVRHLQGHQRNGHCWCLGGIPRHDAHCRCAPGLPCSRRTGCSTAKSRRRITCMSIDCRKTTPRYTLLTEPDMWRTIRFQPLLDLVSASFWE